MTLRIQAVSDLHVDHYPRNHPDFNRTDADVLILAGDIVSLSPRKWSQAVATLKQYATRYKNVVYVPGNHEFYGTGISDVDLDELQDTTGVCVLRPGKLLTINGQRFLGGVMFQPASDAEPISDHYCIDDFSTEAPAQFELLYNWLACELREGDVVVTHHAPSLGSLDPKWAGHPCNRWFITQEMEPLILEKKPALWVHGHVHTPFDYRLGATRVVANPRGYPGEGVAFNPELVLAVPADGAK